MAPDRSFSVDGVDQLYGIAIDPYGDTIFVSRFMGEAQVRVHRLVEASTADGVQTPAASFDPVAGMFGPSDLEYDPSTDTLYVLEEGTLYGFEGASLLDGTVEPARTIALEDDEDDDSGRIEVDWGADRLFHWIPNGTIYVYDDVSTLDGPVTADRVLFLDAPVRFLWGAALDANRDVLYLGDQADEESLIRAVYAVPGASAAAGTLAPDRTIEGEATLLYRPSELLIMPVEDRLIAIRTASPFGFTIFEGASTIDGYVPPDRAVGGAATMLGYSYGGVVDGTR